eukprot:ANDGO_01580.mRNA.1 ABC transporter H family member 4
MNTLSKLVHRLLESWFGPSSMSATTAKAARSPSLSLSLSLSWVLSYAAGLVHPARLFSVLRSLRQRVLCSPTFSFYAYLYNRDPSQLFMTLFVNYVLPIVFEALPWFLSRRKLAQNLREMRNSLHHGMIAGRSIDWMVASQYALATLAHAALDTLDRTLRNRVATTNKWLVRRMVLEKLLFCDLGAMDGSQGSLISQQLASDGALEQKIQGEISSALNLFHYTIPAALSTVYAAFRESVDLWKRRDHVDVLAIVRPSVVQILNALGDFTRRRMAPSSFHSFRPPAATAVSKSDPPVSNAGNAETTVSLGFGRVPPLWSSLMDALVDLQLHNLQFSQLDRFDECVEADLARSESPIVLVERVWSTYASRSVLDFLSETAMVAHVMKKRSISHEQYRRVQIDIDHLLSLFKRTWRNGQTIYQVLKQQDTVGNGGRVAAVLSMPSFWEAERLVPGMVHLLTDFTELRVSGVRFHYPNPNPSMVASKPSVSMNAPVPASTAAAADAAASSSAAVQDHRSHHVSELHPDQQEHERTDGPRDSSAADASCSMTWALDLEDSPDIVFAPGICYGVIGQNRSGKSTLMHLLTKITTCQVGSLLINNIPYDQVSRIAIRSMIAYVPQRPFLFQGTIADNIRMGNEHATEDELLDAAERAGIFAYAENSARPGVGAPNPPVLDQEPLLQEASLSRLEKLKLLASVVQPRGSNLSGGFAQSVALARVFVRFDAKVIILDESMSAMDAWKKRAVIVPRLVEWVRQRRIALILVTHEMEQVRTVCDYVYVLECGKVAGAGSHAELVEARVSAYLKLVGEDSDGRPPLQIDTASVTSDGSRPATPETPT